MPVPDELMRIIVCPDCHGDLEEVPEEQVLVCLSCGLRYPIMDGDIPVLLVEEATRPEQPA